MKNIIKDLQKEYLEVALNVYFTKYGKEKYLELQSLIKSDFKKFEEELSVFLDQYGDEVQDIFEESFVTAVIDK